MAEKNPIAKRLREMYENGVIGHGGKEILLQAAVEIDRLEEDRAYYMRERDNWKRVNGMIKYMAKPRS